MTCSTATTIWLQGMLTQRANRFSLARGDFNRQIACSGTTPWQATVQSSNSVPFGTGSASLTANAFAFDSNSGTGVEDTATATVKLGR